MIQPNSVKAPESLIPGAVYEIKAVGDAKLVDKEVIFLDYASCSAIVFVRTKTSKVLQISRDEILCLIHGPSE